MNGDNGGETEVCIRPEIVHTIMSMGPIIYFFDGRSLSRHKQVFLHLAGALMEHFLEGIAPFKTLAHNPK